MKEQKTALSAQSALMNTSLMMRMGTALDATLFAVILDAHLAQIIV